MSIREGAALVVSALVPVSELQRDCIPLAASPTRTEPLWCERPHQTERLDPSEARAEPNKGIADILICQLRHAFSFTVDSFKFFKGMPLCLIGDSWGPSWFAVRARLVG